MSDEHKQAAVAELARRRQLTREREQQAHAQQREQQREAQRQRGGEVHVSGQTKEQRQRAAADQHLERAEAEHQPAHVPQGLHLQREVSLTSLGWSPTFCLSGVGSRSSGSFCSNSSSSFSL